MSKLGDDKILELFGKKFLDKKTKKKSVEEDDIAAVQNDVSVIETWPKGRQTDNVKIAAIVRDANYIKNFAAADITQEMSRIAVEQMPNLIAFVPDDHKTEEMCRHALFHDAKLIANIPAAYSENLNFLIDIVSRREDLFADLESKIAEFV